jgi:hypothetical protein
MEATSMKQLVRWGAKCRDKSINERIPGSQIIRVEINDLKGNILCYAESDENFPETYTQKKNNAQQLFADALKSQLLGELLFTPENLEFFQSMAGMRDLKIKQVTSRNKQLGEIEMMTAEGAEPMPNEKYTLAMEQIEKMKGFGMDPLQLVQAEQQLASMPQEISSIPPDPQAEDVVGMQAEAETCWWWLNEPIGREAKKNNPRGYENVRLHYIETMDALKQMTAQAGAQGKPPSMSVNFKDVAMIDEGAAKQMLLKDGITPTAGAMQPPAGPTPGMPAKAPARPIPVGAPEQPPSKVQ